MMMEEEVREGGRNLKMLPCWLWRWRGQQARECRRPLEAGKGAETDPLEPPEGTQPCWSILDGWSPGLKHNMFGLRSFVAAALGDEWIQSWSEEKSHPAGLLLPRFCLTGPLCLQTLGEHMTVSHAKSKIWDIKMFRESEPLDEDLCVTEYVKFDSW